MKEACLSDNPRVIVRGVQFFLGGDKEREEIADESDSGDDVDIGRLKHQNQVSKKSKNKSKRLEKAVAVVKRVRIAESGSCSNTRPQ